MREKVCFYILTIGCLLLSLESAGGNELLAFILPIVRMIINIVLKRKFGLIIVEIIRNKAIKHKIVLLVQKLSLTKIKSQMNYQKKGIWYCSFFHTCNFPSPKSIYQQHEYSLVEHTKDESLFLEIFEKLEYVLWFWIIDYYLWTLKDKTKNLQRSVFRH